MKVFGGRIGDDEPMKVPRPRISKPAQEPIKPQTQEGPPLLDATPVPAFPERGAKVTCVVSGGHVVAKLLVLVGAVDRGELCVSVDPTRAATLSWNGMPFGSGRWACSRLTHLQGTAGFVAPVYLNSPTERVVLGALQEIEIALQPVVRGLWDVPRARPPIDGSVAAEPRARLPALGADNRVPWVEPASEKEAEIRRRRAAEEMAGIDSYLATNKSSSPARSEALKRKGQLTAEVMRLKAWLAAAGFTSAGGSKASLWHLVRECHRILERVAPKLEDERDHIEDLLDRIEFAVPAVYLQNRDDVV